MKPEKVCVVVLAALLGCSQSHAIGAVGEDGNFSDGRDSSVSAQTPQSATAVDEPCDGGGRSWYRDCDGDGFAAAGSRFVSCQQPAPEGGCGWTLRQPSSVETTDCDDQRASKFPNAPFGIDEDWDRAGAVASDLNCDGRQEASDQAVALWDGVGEVGQVLALCGAANACPCLERAITYDQLACLYGYPASVRLADANGGCSPASTHLIITLCR